MNYIMTKHENENKLSVYIAQQFTIYIIKTDVTLRNTLYRNTLYPRGYTYKSNDWSKNVKYITNMKNIYKYCILRPIKTAIYIALFYSGRLAVQMT